MHKNMLSSQVCCASPKKPYITHDELRILYEGYFKLSDLMKRTRNNAKIYFISNEQYSLYSWVSLCLRSSSAATRVSVPTNDAALDYGQFRTALHVQSTGYAGRSCGYRGAYASTLEEGGEEAFLESQCPGRSVRVVSTS